MLIEKLREHGVVGAGGAGFPTYVKAQSQVEYMIANGAECEPYISCDDMLMRENAAEVVAGALLLTDVLAAPRCIIAIERDKQVQIITVPSVDRHRLFPVR